MKIVASAVLLVGLLSAGCCGTFGFRPYYPRLTDEDWDAFKTAMRHLKVGSTERVLKHFDIVTEEGGIGILNMSTTEAEGYYGRVYEIGYRQREHVGAGVLAVVPHTICYITVINGRVSAIYRP